MEIKSRIVPQYDPKEVAKLAKEAVSTGQTASFIWTIKLIIDLYTDVLEKVEKGGTPNTGTATICKEVRRDIAYLKRQINKIRKAEQRRQVRTPIALDSNLTKGGRQLQINFDDLDRDTQGNLRQLNIYEKKLSVGIETDADGYEILITLSTLLHAHSKNTTNPKAADFYRGDKMAVVNWKGGDTEAVFIKTTLAEITKLRTGEEKTNKWERERTRAMLLKYAGKPYIVEYKEYYTEKGKGGKEKRGKRTITTNAALFFADIIDDDDKTTRRNIVKIWLTPLFWRQIESDFNSRPADYLPRLKRAYQQATNSSIVRSVPVSLHYFATRLIENTGSKERTYNVNLKNLYQQIDSSAVKARQWGALQSTLDLYIKVVESIGLLKSWHTYTNDQSEQIAVFKVVEKDEWR